MLKLLKAPMKQNCFIAYFKVYLSKLKIPKFEVLSIINGRFYKRLRLSFFALIAEIADGEKSEKMGGRYCVAGAPNQ